MRRSQSIRARPRRQPARGGGHGTAAIPLCNMLEYKGYTGHAVFDAEASLFHGEVLDTRTGTGSGADKGLLRPAENTRFRYHSAL